MLYLHKRPCCLATHWIQVGRGQTFTETWELAPESNTAVLMSPWPSLFAVAIIFRLLSTAHGHTYCFATVYYPFISNLLKSGEIGSNIKYISSDKGGEKEEEENINC